MNDRLRVDTHGKDWMQIWLKPTWTHGQKQGNENERVEL